MKKKNQKAAREESDSEKREVRRQEDLKKKEKVQVANEGGKIKTDASDVNTNSERWKDDMAGRRS